MCWRGFGSRSGWWKHPSRRIWSAALLCGVALVIADLNVPLDSPPAVINLVNDATGLNPIAVQQVFAPTTTDEIVRKVREWNGPISIGGARYSMGGQTAREDSLHLDMRQYNKIVSVSVRDKTITVQSGATWRQILDYIDPYNLSVKVMQTYANFTVGGSLSVNAHGRYVGLGPIISSVRSMQVVLADGRLVTTSSHENSQVFYGAIGGYGGLGVIAEVTLELTDNVRVERIVATMPVKQYRRHFAENIGNSPRVIFHNADIYPDSYDTVNAVSYVVSDKPLTVGERLIEPSESYHLWHFLGTVVGTWPLGKAIRQHVFDPVLYSSSLVEWRNHEASYDVAELPVSNGTAAYVLQEYFIPVDGFDRFIPKLREILNKHSVNALNVSIRHAKKDPGSMMAWARSDVFAFVLYYRQRTDAESRTHVAEWTRELIDAALSLDGTYYLPYQLLATPEQFARAYPNAPAFFRLKSHVDPSNKFRNKLWDKYLAVDAAM